MNDRLGLVDGGRYDQAEGIPMGLKVGSEKNICRRNRFRLQGWKRGGFGRKGVTHFIKKPPKSFLRGKNRNQGGRAKSDVLKISLKKTKKGKNIYMGGAGGPS